MLFNSLEKKFAPLMKRCIEKDFILAGTSFSLLPDRAFISANSEELNETLLKLLGGDYQGSISITYYKDGKLALELYFSDARGRVVGPALKQVAAAFDKTRFSCIQYSLFRPGESCASLRLEVDGVNENTFSQKFSSLTMEAMGSVFGTFTGMGLL